MPLKPYVVVESAPLKYLLSIPSTPPTGRPAPLLCFLHGYDEGGPRPVEEALTLHGPLSPTSSHVATEVFVVVAPQLPAKGDIWARYAGMVQQLVRQVETAYHTEPAQRYLTGFSFGANGVFDLSLAQPDYWTALWAVDPTRVPEADPGRPLWLSSGQLSRGASKDYARRLALAPTSEGPRIYEDAGKGHVETARAAYSDERVYRWLLSQRL